MVTLWLQEPVSQGKDGKEQHFVDTALGVGMGVDSGDSIGKKEDQASTNIPLKSEFRRLLVVKFCSWSRVLGGPLPVG